jgi:uncharacterized protein (DUF1501 family)
MHGVPHTRRSFLTRSSHGFGGMALWHLLAQDGLAAQPHFAPRAKRVIFIFMMGGPSQVDLFDPKPTMAALHGQPLPSSILASAKKSSTGGVLETVMASPRKFSRHGRCGMDFSELLPHTSARADSICMIRSMHCEQSSHDPAQLLLHSGSPLFGNPSMGAWVNYGLGSVSQDLPGYLVLLSHDGDGLEGAGAALWGSGFMPSTYRGVTVRGSGDAILHLGNPRGVGVATQRARLDAVAGLNRLNLERTGDPEIASRIAAYEMAFRMQAAAPELADLGGETAATRALYGLDDETTRPFGTNCLLARRMVERGVRFVHLVHSSWDHHAKLASRLEHNCRMTDRGTAALLADLDQRGMLDDTLVVWAGEFGRTPMGEVRRGASGDGRDHHPQAFSLWLAGGGVKRGHVHGETDDFGYSVVADPVHVHDLQATILHLLGIDHTRLTYRHAGRDHRLTDVHGEVVRAILA